MESYQKLEIRILEAYTAILQKENLLLHHKKYALTLLHFERFLQNENLIQQALNAHGGNLEDFRFTKKTLEQYKRTFTDVTNELTYKGYYQIFEEYIFQVLTALFTVYPVFLKNESEQFDVSFENIFITSDILETQNLIIEKKVKGIIQANNIIKTIRKIEKIFGLDFEISTGELQELFKASLIRNVLTHNNGVINRIYLQELKNQQMITNFKVGDSVFPALDEKIQNLTKVIDSIGAIIYKSLSIKLKQIDKYATSLVSMAGKNSF